MSRHPRGPSATAPAGTPGGLIRPPNSGLTLPRALASNLHAGVPATPALTQRIQTGSRRATLTTATFMPLRTDGSATISRSSGIGAASATRLLGIAATGPSASFVPSGEPHATFAARTPGHPAVRDAARLGTMSRVHAMSPTVEPLASHGSGEGIAREASLMVGRDYPVRHMAETPSVPRLGHAISEASSSSLTQNASNDDTPRSGSIGGLRCGEAVLIPTQGLRGTLRYLGPIDGKQGAWAGIELDETGKGKNDGSVAGKSYFSCQPNSGLFLAPSKVQPIPQMEKAASATQTADHSFLGSAQANSGHPALVPEPQHVQKKQTDRSRIGNEVHSAIGMSHTPGGRSITSPMLSHRKTLSRATTIAANTPVPEIPPGPSRTRLPPATISRGPSRTRPISTTGSIVSNRTSSPLLSRPSSRTLAPSFNAELSTHTLSPTRKPAAIQRTKLFANTPNADQRQPRRNTGMQRPTAASSVRPTEQANGKSTSVAQRSRTGAPADSMERLRLRVDMVEAENRMLRLKNEQDKAHLAAGQMLARDLAIVNGSTTPQTHILGSPSGLGGSAISLAEQQLKEVRDTLEQERVVAKETIESLEHEVRSLKLGSTNEGFPSSGSSSGSEETKQNTVVDTRDACVAFNSLPDSSELESRVSEMQGVLKRAEESHAKDILASENAYSQLCRTLEDKNAMAESMEAQLSSKIEETSALSSRFEIITAELDKCTRLYQDLLQTEGSDKGGDDQDTVSALNGQIERFQLQITSANDAKVELMAELDDTKKTLSVANEQLSRALCSLEEIQKKSLDSDSLRAFVEEYHSGVYRLVSLFGEHGDEHGLSVRQGLDGIPAEFNQSYISLEAVSQLFSSANRCVNQLSDKAYSASNQMEAMADEVQSKDARISTLETELSDLKRQLAQSPSETLADSDDHGSASQQQYLQARIDELEGMNDELMEQCDSLIEERAMFNEHLKMLEAESNRLVDDIDQLTAQNQKLAEELRVTSMQNSTVSLDMAALDSKLRGDLQAASSDNVGSAEPAADSGPTAADINADKDDAEDLDSLRRKHYLEMSDLQSRFADLELRKNNEIKRLQDDVISAENVAEDKLFKEMELSGKVSALTDQIDRLQREIQRSTGASGSTTNGRSISESDSGPVNSNGRTAGSPLPTTDDSMSGSIVVKREAIKSAVESIDDESLYCDICESFGHAISDCPQMAAPSNIFKQEVSIDSSRPYCDNCEAFEGHWTDDCPHGDEMF